MAGGMEKLFGPIFEKLFGKAAIFGGIFLALSGWFLDYAVLEWRRRRGYSVLLAIVGAGMVGMVFYFEWDFQSLIKCAFLAVLFYLPLRWSIRRAN
jgi:hypothetical protein